MSRRISDSVPPAPQATTGPKFVLHHHSDEHLDPGCGHGLNQEAGPGDGRAPRPRRAIAFGGGPRLVGAAQVDANATGIGLVHEAGGDRLEATRPPSSAAIAADGVGVCASRLLEPR